MFAHEIDPPVNGVVVRVDYVLVPNGQSTLRPDWIS